MQRFNLKSIVRNIFSTEPNCGAGSKILCMMKKPGRDPCSARTQDMLELKIGLLHGLLLPWKLSIGIFVNALKLDIMLAKVGGKTLKEKNSLHDSNSNNKTIFDPYICSWS